MDNGLLPLAMNGQSRRLAPCTLFRHWGPSLVTTRYGSIKFFTLRRQTLYSTYQDHVPLCLSRRASIRTFSTRWEADSIKPSAPAFSADSFLHCTTEDGSAQHDYGDKSVLRLSCAGEMADHSCVLDPHKRKVRERAVLILPEGFGCRLLRHSWREPGFPFSTILFPMPIVQTAFLNGPMAAVMPDLYRNVVCHRN